MRVHVKFDETCVVVPCEDGKHSVKWLLTQALLRFQTLGDGISSNGSNACLQLPNDGGTLWSDDVIQDVLENDDFVEMRCEILYLCNLTLFGFEWFYLVLVEIEKNGFVRLHF